MCGQGDVDCIGDWRSKHSIDDLKKICEEKGYSAISVGSFGHAALKSFDYQLTKDHCAPSNGYTNTIYILHYEDEEEAGGDVTLHELESHPGKGLKLNKGGEHGGHPYYFLALVDLKDAHKFTYMAGPGFVRCQDIKNAQFDLAHGKFEDDTEVVAYHCHGAENQKFELQKDGSLAMRNGKHLKLCPRDDTSHGRVHSKVKDVYRFKLTTEGETAGK